MKKTSSTSLPKRQALAATVAASTGESIRESVEAIIVAIILTLSFRTFLGENYQIPTGSMAPTLQGRHMDVECPDCGYQYRTGASIENVEDGRVRGEVRETTCPICRYVLVLDKKADLNQRSFAGDRIIVNKLAYLYAEPQRWDVFVFKYPGNPKINYIKRLVGLPGETIRIRHGDIWIADTFELQAGLAPDFRIARKPPDKVEAMLQLVDDTYYLPMSLQEMGWPFRWGAVNPAGEAWQLSAEGSVSIEPTAEDAWVGYRHLIPRDEDRDVMERGGRPDLTGYYGQLITDYYAYNDGHPRPPYSTYYTDGWNWVGDLALEVNLELLTDAGELLFDIVEGGLHHYCRVDTATGRATLTLSDGPFGDGEEGSPPTRKEVTADTPLRGAGTYAVKFANVDDQLFLWVNGQSIGFDGPTTFRAAADARPNWSPEEPGDMVPLRVGARNAGVRVDRFRVWRDVYYIAARFDDRVADSDYGPLWAENIEDIFTVLTDPTTWSTTELFASRRDVMFSLEADQFLPLGDNSPQSKDARLWSVATENGLEPPPYVRRELLIGKAVFIYWPHSWNFPWIPSMIPNYQRVGSIR